MNTSVRVSSVLLSASLALCAQTAMNDLGSLTMIRSGVKSKRISSYDRSGGNNDRFENIPAGERRTLFEVSGAGIINHIWITIAPPPPGLSRNDLVLRMYWDGNSEPSVLSPLGPFFGQGWDEAYNFVSLPLSANPVEGRALVSYFQMPFAKGAKIEVENQSNRKVDAFYYYVDYVEMEKLPDHLGRFHAWYNHQLTDADPQGENEWDTLGPGGKNTTGERNYLFADITGKGHFVGVNYYVNSPSPMWYGEGDDMFFVDGAKTPTLHGTGTEDYFNTSWCPKDKLSHPYFGYARVNGETGWLGRTHVYRFHISDPIYFDQSLKCGIEHGHNNVLTLDLASVAYWYLDKATGVKPIPGRQERQPKPVIGAVEMHKWRHEWRKEKEAKPTLWGNEK
ncbi:MAG TPA: DUF2961 domain-containing protein [Candidatus Paceibacterota bacterium]|nr:DUF2961 domain-containing protein [Verrucomicrobiota bacterium]HSA01629.1 DUF2961 domain-containing protein [Candidatus Paceibacterota bacterium]